MKASLSRVTIAWLTMFGILMLSIILGSVVIGFIVLGISWVNANYGNGGAWLAAVVVFCATIASWYAWDVARGKAP